MRNLFAAFCLFLAACSGGEDVATAEKSIEIFHEQLNAGKFQEIHNQAGSEWKGAITGADAVKLFAAVRTKLGEFKSRKQSGWRVNYGQGKTIVVQYESQFERGTAVETFTLKRSGEEAQMIGYNINSNALITG